MIGWLRTRVRKQPIIALYFESETVLKFYNLEVWCLASKSYERYKQELLAWMEVTEVSRSKQGILIASTLPNEETFKIREHA